MDANAIETIYRLTPAQEGIVFHALEAGARSVYFEQYSCRIDGTLDAERLERIWQFLAARHPALRTFISWRREQAPVQVVLSRVDLPFDLQDWREHSALEQQRRWSSLLARDRERGFELTRPPLLRITLVRIGEQAYRFLLSFHHVIMDGWSLRVLLAEAQQLYRADDSDWPHVLPAAGRFADYVAWLESRDDEAARRYFRDRFGEVDEATPIALPLPTASSVSEGAEARTVELSLSAEQAADLERTVRGERLTLSALFTAVWALLLGRYADQEMVTIGTTLAGRPATLSRIESTVGLLINTLPLRLRVDGEGSVREWLQVAQSAQRELLEHEHAPLSLALESSAMPRGRPLFDALMVMQSVAEASSDSAPWSVSEERYAEFSNFPLALLVRPDDGLHLTLVYDPGRFDGENVSRLGEHLRTLLFTVVTQLDARLDSLDVLDATEREVVLRRWNDTRHDIASTPPIHAAVERHARQAPETVAVDSHDGTLTFAALNAAANRLARHLRSLGVEIGDPVAIALHRSCDAIVAIVAALKAGAAYVPIDPALPGDRVAWVLDDLARSRAHSQTPLVMVTGAEQVETMTDGAFTLVAVDALETALQDERDDDLELDLGGEQLAYIMYTSGSTGQPKGVMITHAALVNSCAAREHYYERRPERFLLLSSLATDSSIAGLFWTLTAGTTLVLPAPQQEQDVLAIGDLIETTGVTHLLCVPSLYSLLIEHVAAATLESLRTAIVAGEACPLQVVTAHCERLPDTELHNEYGPTEATVWASASRLDRTTAEGTVTIGRPIANTRIYVLDSRLRPMPAGVAGELFIGGVQVASGYLNQPQLTNDRFLPDPFAHEAQTRMYRTGDRARWTDDGQLVFLGRVDNQIKVRGFRVEPEEIESVLSMHPSVAEAAVVLSAHGEGGAQTRRLAACVVADGELPSSDELRAFVEQRLPAHMVPGIVLGLEMMPRTAAGKIDRDALAARAAGARTGADHDLVPPRNEIEATLLAIWRDVLATDAIGVEDDFFSAGGDSLLSVRVLARANRRGLAITPEAFFAEPTVAAQAAAVARSKTLDGESGLITGSFAPLPGQQQVLERLVADGCTGSFALRLTLDARIGASDFERVLQRLLLHHDALRLRLVRADHGLQLRLDDLGPDLPLRWLGDVARDGDERENVIARELLVMEQQLDPWRGAVFAASVLEHRASPINDLLLVGHPLALDTGSWQLLVDDLGTLADQVLNEAPLTLPDKTVSVKTCARRYQETAGEGRLPDADAAMSTNAAHSSHPQTGPRPDVVTIEQRLARTDDGTVLDSDARVLAALAAALGQELASTRVRLELEWTPREELLPDLDVSRTVGALAVVLPFDVDIEDDESSPPAALTQELAATHAQRTPAHARLLHDDGALGEPAFARVRLRHLDGGASRVHAVARDDGWPLPRPSLLALTSVPVMVDALSEEGALRLHWHADPGRVSERTLQESMQRFARSYQRQSATGAIDPVVRFPLADLDRAAFEEVARQLAELDRETS